jgi:hypothetical protein
MSLAYSSLEIHALYTIVLERAYSVCRMGGGDSGSDSRLLLSSLCRCRSQKHPGSGPLGGGGVGGGGENGPYLRQGNICSRNRPTHHHALLLEDVYLY